MCAVGNGMQATVAECDSPLAVRIQSTRRAGSKGRAVPRLRLLALLGGGVALLLGMYTGLARGGVEHRFVAADLHAILMVLGFLGTLIALERAVALGARWAYAAPAASALSVMVLPVNRSVGGILLVVAGVLTTSGYVVLLRRQLSIHLAVMAVGALAWVVAAALWLGGSGPVRITPLLAAFLVLTVVGERLELSRLTLPAPASRRRFLGATALFFLGALMAPAWRSAGLVLVGAGLLGQTAWLVRHDVARVTVRRAGLPRFIAVSLLAGYGWLAVSGVLWVAMGLGARGALLHDAVVHSLFLGFVLSMVMGHAPIILPAVLRLPVRFTRAAYLPLVALHVSVVVRIAADLAGSVWWRGIALHGNVVALLLFVLMTVSAARHGLRHRLEVTP
jgi:hypothetical protein